MPVGTAVRLSRLDRANTETIRAWLNDPEVNRWLLAGQVPISVDEEVAYFQDSENQWRAGTAYRFEIHVLEDDRLIGTCGLEDVSARHRSAEIGISIGSIPDQNRGCGRDAIVTLCRFGFDTLGLHRIAIRAHIGNERGCYLYDSIGFTEVGCEREAVFMRGAYGNHVVFDMLEDEFRERYGHR